MNTTRTLKLHEIKGKLEAQNIILSNTLTALKGLNDELSSQYYKGHTRGRIETLSRWSVEVARLQSDIEQLIQEAESD